MTQKKPSPTPAEIFKPNSYNCELDKEVWSPWDALGIHLGGYSAATDTDAINVLQGIQDKLYCDKIAERYNMAPSHVELLQYIFCSANWCEYGTSPRGCFPDYSIWGDDGLKPAIEKWKEYYFETWQIKFEEQP